MKRALLLVILSFSMLAVSAQIEVFCNINESATPCINVYGVKPIAKQWNLSYFFLVQETWAEGMLGFEYYPVPWLELGLNCGLEQNPALFRVGGSLYLLGKKSSLIALWEKGDGQENYWYKATAMYKILPKSSLGVRAWRFIGVGPMLEKEVPGLKGANAWIMPAYNIFEDKTSSLVVGLTFKI